MRFRFGVFELDDHAGELRRAGEPVHLQPKPFELLRLLIRERDRIVPTDELMRTLWPDTVVSPASLNRAVTHARRALGDTSRGTLIKSIARRGYRFMGEVLELPADLDLPAHAHADEGSLSPSAPGPARWAEGAPGPAPRGAPRTTSALGLDPTDRGQFVGRQDALARLGAARDAVLRGECRIAVLSGRPGIGKTRLAEVCARAAVRQGFFGIWGRARDREGMPAFWVWAQVLRGLAEEPSLAAELSQRVASGELAALRPALVEFAPDLVSGLGPDPASDVAASADPTLVHTSEQQRFRFFDASLRALRACARRRPIVLVLEDLQWAGSGSLRLLEYIATELEGAPLLLIATVRDEVRERGHPVDRTVATLRQQARTESIPLEGLTRRDVGELLSAAIGSPAPVDLISELYARTEGVPFFVGEAVRFLAERGDLARPDRIPRQGVTLPARAVDLIRRAIDGVSEECLALLRAGAVIGREFTLGAATAVAGRAREEALDPLDEGIRAGILEEPTGSVATYRFTHALFQEAIYESLTPGERARLHRAAALRLEHQHAGALEPVLSELAHHHHHAIAVGDPEQAFDHALRAAREAERLFAWEQAAVHYEQAVSAFEHFDVVDPNLRVQTLLALGEAHRVSGNRARRIEAFSQAVDGARALESPELFARSAIGLCDVSEWSARVPERSSEILEEALVSVGPEDLVTRARLMTRLGYLAVRDRSSAEPLGREAVALARESGDPVALQETLYILHYIISGPDSLDERERLIGELKRAGEACAHRDAAVIALLDVACDGLMQGDPQKARIHRRFAAELVGRNPSPTALWHLRVWDAGLALLEGRFVEAEQGARDALQLGRRLAHPFALACYTGQLCMLDRDRGREREVLEALEPTLSSESGATHWSRAVAGRAAAALGDLTRARSHLDDLARSGFEGIARTIRWNGTVTEVALLAAELAAADHAKPLIEMLESAPEQHGLLPMPINYAGPLVRCRAALWSVLGVADEAAALYLEALEAASRLGARPVVARIQLEAAPLFLRKGDTPTARELLRESEASSRELGMSRVLEQASELGRRL